MQRTEAFTTSIRIPLWVRNKIKARAEHERRSFNAMLNILLEQAVQKEKETAES